MHVLVLADIDDLHWKYGPGKADIVLSCGDVLDQVILEAAQAHSCRHVYAVKGNHDAPAAFTAPIVDLHLQVVEHQRLWFGGLNGSWRYKPRGHFLYEQAEVDQLLSTFPPVDVFVGHNSPSGIHDRDDGVHQGFNALHRYIARAHPRLVFHGHQHVKAETRLGDTWIIGVFGYRCITTATSAESSVGADLHDDRRHGRVRHPANDPRERPHHLVGTPEPVTPRGDHLASVI